MHPSGYRRRCLGSRLAIADRTGAAAQQNAGLVLGDDRIAQVDVEHAGIADGKPGIAVLHCHILQVQAGRIRLQRDAFVEALDRQSLEYSRWPRRWKAVIPVVHEADPGSFRPSITFRPLKVRFCSMTSGASGIAKAHAEGRTRSASSRV